MCRAVDGASAPDSFGAWAVCRLDAAGSAHQPRDRSSAARSLRRKLSALFLSVFWRHSSVRFFSEICMESRAVCCNRASPRSSGVDRPDFRPVQFIRYACVTPHLSLWEFHLCLLVCSVHSRTDCETGICRAPLPTAVCACRAQCVASTLCIDEKFRPVSECLLCA
jgi:hypothetical protein